MMALEVYGRAQAGTADELAAMRSHNGPLDKGGEYAITRTRDRFPRAVEGHATTATEALWAGDLVAAERIATPPAAFGSAGDVLPDSPPTRM